MDWLLTLKGMIGDEQAAQAKYQHAAEMADKAELKAIFSQLHDEEVVHQRILEGWIDTLQKQAKKKG
jgi:rubrerythrin